jgi:hypothetical protein
MKDIEHNGHKFEDTKEVIRRHKSMKDREHNGQKFEDTKGVIRRHKFVSSDCSFGIFKLLAIVFSVLH